jgi:hypothetical protein
MKTLGRTAMTAMTDLVTFPERPFARFLSIEEREWEDTNEPVWVVWLYNEAADQHRELGTFDTYHEAKRFADDWSPDRDLFGNLLPLPEEDDTF